MKDLLLFFLDLFEGVLAAANQCHQWRRQAQAGAPRVRKSYRQTNRLAELFACEKSYFLYRTSDSLQMMGDDRVAVIPGVGPCAMGILDSFISHTEKLEWEAFSAGPVGAKWHVVVVEKFAFLLNLLQRVESESHRDCHQIDYSSK